MYSMQTKQRIIAILVLPAFAGTLLVWAFLFVGRTQWNESCLGTIDQIAQLTATRDGRLPDDWKQFLRLLPETNRSPVLSQQQVEEYMVVRWGNNVEALAKSNELPIVVGKRKHWQLTQTACNARFCIIYLAHSRRPELSALRTLNVVTHESGP
jgi:hypothetical protein